MKQMPANRQKEIASKCGWNRLDEKIVTVSVPLTDVEKAQMGEELAKRMEEVQEQTCELKAYAKERKEEIGLIQSHCDDLARQIRSRRKDVEVNAPGFYDPQEKARIYLNPETEEIIHREAAEPGDAQSRIA